MVVCVLGTRDVPHSGQGALELPQGEAGERLEVVGAMTLPIAAFLRCAKFSLFPALHQSWK